MRPGDLLGVAALAGIWGSSFLFVEHALTGLSAAQIVLVRLFGGGLLLLGVATAMRAPLPCSWRVLGRLTVMGLIGQAVPWLLFTIGQEEVPTALAGIYTGATPLLTIPVVLVMLRVRSSRPEVVASVLGFIGLVVVLSPWREQAEATLRGQLLCLGGALCYALAFGYIGRLLRSIDLPKVSLAAAQALLAGMVMLPASGRSSVAAPDLDAVVTASAVVLALGTAAAFLLNYWLIARIGPVRASLAFYLIPVVALVLGVSILGEDLAVHQLGGAAIILAALGLLFVWERHQEKAAGDGPTTEHPPTPGSSGPVAAGEAGAAVVAAPAHPSRPDPQETA